jgi:hypothetical protein
LSDGNNEDRCGVIQVVWHLLVASGALCLAWSVRRDTHGLFAIGALINLAADL